MCARRPWRCRPRSRSSTRSSLPYVVVVVVGGGFVLLYINRLGRCRSCDSNHPGRGEYRSFDHRLGAARHCQSANGAVCTRTRWCTGARELLADSTRLVARFHRCADALQQASHFTKISKDADNVFQTNDIHKIASQLAVMRRSLTVLQDLPQFKDSHKTLSNLHRRLEEMAKPLLTQAIRQHDVGTR